MLAAHRDHLAGHEGGVLAGQEDDDVGHLPGLGPPAEDLPPAELLQLLVGHHLVEEGVEGQARRDRVDPDAVGGRLDGARTG